MNALQDLIKTYASQYKEQVVEWRRHIHSHPELSGEEKNTSLFIQKVLGELEIPFVNDVSDYAVIGKIEGAHTGPVIALRADMDALPIHEITGLPFASQNEGVMHACGHDSHMAILLGAAAILQSIKDQLHGTVKLVFQPSEEEALFPGAQGIVDAYKNMGTDIKVPIIVRLQGTNAEIAKEIIDKSGLAVHSAIQFQEAADKVKEVLK